MKGSTLRRIPHLLLAALVLLGWAAGPAVADPHSSAGAAVAGPRPLTAGDWAAIRAGAAGRPQVVHFWSVTCGPCLVELPHWAGLRQALPRAALTLVATDGAEDLPRITATLARVGLSAAESWYFADPWVERLRHRLHPGWQGQLPFTLLIAADGTVTALEGPAVTQARRWLDGEG